MVRNSSCFFFVICRGSRGNFDVWKEILYLLDVLILIERWIINVKDVIIENKFFSILCKFYFFCLNILKGLVFF